MNDLKKSLPERQRHAIATGARRGREIQREAIRAGFTEARRADAAEEAAAARDRIVEAGGVRALDRRSYETEKQAMLHRLRRAR